MNRAVDAAEVRTAATAPIALSLRVHPLVLSSEVFNHLIIFPMMREKIDPTALRAMRFPTVPRLTAFTSPRIRATI